MAKAPVAGFAKTRLVPALGEHGAALLAEQLLAHTLAQATGAGARSITLWVTPDASHPAFVDAQQRHGVIIHIQSSGELGARMARVFQIAFDADPSPVLLMGTDAPALDAALLRRAAGALVDHDAVFVPALDGGYALVGLCAAPTALLQTLFSDMRWSTPQVMQQTRDRLRASGHRYAELPAVADIDEPADLVHLPPGFGGSAPSAATASTITPRPAARASRDDMQETLPSADDSTPADPVATDPVPTTDALPHEDTPPDVDVVESAPEAPTETATEAASDLASDAAAAVPAPEAASAEPKPPAAPPAPDLAPAACAALLAQHFPALFGKGVFLPIKLRIQADIQTRVPGVFNKKSLSIFLHRHTTGTAYIKALAKATQRFNLDGQPDGEIAPEHQEAAVAELARRREIVDGRRAQEREAQRAKQQEERNAARKAQQAREAAQHSAEHEARRERAALLRAFEGSTLTRANFCALKGIPEDTLDARLDQAWHEREARAHEAPPPPAARRRPDGRGERGERNRPRGPRPAGKPADRKSTVQQVVGTTDDKPSATQAADPAPSGEPELKPAS